LNLFDNPYPFKGPLDLIFCRNVMIYFKKEDQVKIIEEKFYNLLKPSGHLFLGHAESLAGVRSKFRFIQPSIYVK
jgi:chemotaxis protein methyltransferase CheR